METLQPTAPSSQTLLEAFNERRARNPRYSLRAFARHLEISPAQLSQMLSGKRALSRQMVERLSQKLNLSPREKYKLIADCLKTPMQPATKWAESLSEDQFRVIADWYHMAILALCHVAENRADSNWISQQLGITKLEALQAVQRLVRLQVLQIENGRMRQIGNPFAIEAPNGSQAVRRFHCQVLELAEKALHKVPVHQRDYSAVVFAGDPKKLQKVRDLINEIQAEAMHEMGQGKQVYVLACQLFPVAVESVKGN